MPKPRCSKNNFEFNINELDYGLYLVMTNFLCWLVSFLRVAKIQTLSSTVYHGFYSFCFTLCSASIQKSISFNSIVGQPLSQRAHIQVKQIVISTLESIQIILGMGNSADIFMIAQRTFSIRSTVSRY